MSREAPVLASSPRQAIRPSRRQFRMRRLVGSLTIHVPLSLCGVVMAFPLVWLLSTSLKDPGEQFAFPPQLIPTPLYLKNFTDLFRLLPMWLFIFNSMKISVLSVVGGCLSSALAAFAFARMRFRGRDVLFAVLLATMMIPTQVTIIPTFVLMRLLGWLNNHAALIVPNVFGSAFNVFLLRQFYRGIPQDLIDSAKIDGAGFVRIFWQIFIPLGTPALASVAVFNFLWSWNDLLGPLIFLNTQNNFTITLGLTFLQGRAGETRGHWGVMMAGALLGVIPMIVLYLLAQRYFVQGLARTGIKG